MAVNENSILQPLPLLAAGAILITVATACPVFTTTTNCGGNSAALSIVGSLAMTAHTSAQDASFSFSNPPKDDQALISQKATSHWLPHAHFLVAKQPVTLSDAHTHRLIVVCDTPYRNVPEKWIGSAPPTHAAGYADGKTALISEAEFMALDRSSFIALDALDLK